MRCAASCCVLAGAVCLSAAEPRELAVYRPVEREVARHADFIGKAEASKTIALQARSDGVIEKIQVRDGDLVKKGQLLFQLDARACQLDADRARAEVLRAEATLKLADADFNRLRQLLDKNGAAREEVDKAAAQRDIGRAALEAARAALERARLELDFTRITAPLDGCVGSVNYEAGAFVKGFDGARPLTTLRVLDPLHVAFAVDEGSLPAVRRALQAGAAVQLRFQGDDKARESKIDFVDTQVHPETGTVKIRAVLPNPADAILPGQRAEVRVLLAPPQQMLLVAASAVFTRNGQPTVLVVGAQNKLVERSVKLGPMSGQLRAIAEGLAATDWVVAEPASASAGDEIKPKQLAEPPQRGEIRPAEQPQGAVAPELPFFGPSVVIQTSYPGASAGVVREAVAQPIEQQLNGLEGVVQRVAACGNDGTLTITLLFKKGADLNEAAQLASHRVQLAQPVLPDAVQRQGIVVKKQGKFLLAVVISLRDDRKALTRVATSLRDDLFRVPGITEVSFHGNPGQAEQLQLHVDRDKLAAFNLTMADVKAALDTDAVAVGPRLALRTKETPDELGKTIVKALDGVPIRLRDVAAIELVSGWNTLTDVDGKPSVILLLQQSIAANPRETAKAVAARLEESAKTWPKGVEYRLLNNEP